jgi:hypothetical protein
MSPTAAPVSVPPFGAFGLAVGAAAAALGLAAEAALVGEAAGAADAPPVLAVAALVEVAAAAALGAAEAAVDGAALAAADGAALGAADGAVLGARVGVGEAPQAARMPAIEAALTPHTVSRMKSRRFKPLAAHCAPSSLRS